LGKGRKKEMVGKDQPTRPRVKGGGTGHWTPGGGVKRNGGNLGGGKSPEKTTVGTEKGTKIEKTRGSIPWGCGTGRSKEIVTQNK